MPLTLVQMYFTIYLMHLCSSQFQEIQTEIENEDQTIAPPALVQAPQDETAIDEQGIIPEESPSTLCTIEEVFKSLNNNPSSLSLLRCIAKNCLCFP